jgi:2-desacetyl-2-hydroxyethyl bacteriochlorophyllide A dehydrogenase
MYKTAKAVVIEKPRQAAIREIPIAPVDDQTVVVKTTYSAISMGTEMKVWSGLSGSLGGELWYPLIPGYEEVGEVVYVGKKSPYKLKVGDRVMANEVRYFPEHCHAWGGQCGLAIKNSKTSPSPFDYPVKIPNNVSDKEAVMAYLATVAHKGINRVKPKKGQTVFIIGMGMIGMSWIQLAKLAGCRVIAMDINDRRLKLGSKFADDVIDGKCYDPAEVLKKLTKGNQADIIVECSGDPTVVTDLYKYLRDGGWGLDDAPGHIHLQADYPWPITFAPYQKWFTKNVNMSLTCALQPGGKEAILKLISEGKFDAKTLLESDMTLELPVDDAPKAYQMVDQSKKDIFKVLLKW